MKCVLFFWSYRCALCYLIFFMSVLFLYVLWNTHKKMSKLCNKFKDTDWTARLTCLSKPLFIGCFFLLPIHKNLLYFEWFLYLNFLLHSIFRDLFYATFIKYIYCKSSKWRLINCILRWRSEPFLGENRSFSIR